MRAPRPVSPGRRSLCPAALLVVAVIAAPSAHAATASVETRQDDQVDLDLVTIHFEAAAGEANALSAARTSPDAFVFTDSGATIAPGPGCSGGGAPGAPVTCMAPGLDMSRVDLDRVVVRLGDGDDTLDATALSAPGTEPEDELLLQTRLEAGPGRTRHSAEAAPTTSTRGRVTTSSMPGRATTSC